MAKHSDQPLRDANRAMQANVTRGGPALFASYGLVGGILAFGALGYFADGWLMTSPWLLLLGLVTGVVLGFAGLISRLPRS